MDAAEKTGAAAPTPPTRALTRSRQADLVPADPLQRYMQEVRRYPILDRDEEHDVAVHFDETEDPDAAFKLITANLRLVVKIAMEYQHTRVPVVDLVQEGNVGLVLALKKYDPYKGVRFGSYAQWWIRAYILKYLMDNFSLVKVGTTQAQRKLFYNLKKERSRLESMGVDPTAEALADVLEVRTTDVVEMQKRLQGSGEVSIHTPLREGESGELQDLLPQAGPTAEDMTAQAQLSEKIEQYLAEFRSSLDDRTTVFWDRRLMSDEPWTLQQLGDEFGVSRERARQIEARILRDLKSFLRREMPELEHLDLAMGGA